MCRFCTAHYSKGRRKDAGDDVLETGRLCAGLTYGTEEAQEQEKDDTPDDIPVDATFQLTALVARTSVVQHSFRLMAYSTVCVCNHL